MKKITILMFIVLTAFSGQVIGQKIGYINTQEILQLMPETAVANNELAALANSLDEQDSILNAEYQNKIADFQKDQQNPDISESILLMKYNQINDLEKRIEQFKQTAQQELVEKQNKLIKPLVEKINNAIDEVAKENNYNYVLDNSTGAILFAANEKDNILPLVKAKLGITD
jgi:outer membrane protein